MGMRALKKHVALEGHVGVEDAETLLSALRAMARPAVHLGRCEHVHAAVLQVLLALRPRVVAAAADPWLQAALNGEAA
jgi:hypothetical protein